MSTVYLIVDTSRYRPPIYRVECQTEAEVEFVRGMHGEWAGNLEDGCASESEEGASFGLGELEAWLDGKSKEDIFDAADLAAGVWPAVLTDDFRARFTPARDGRVFMAMVCR